VVRLGGSLEACRSMLSREVEVGGCDNMLGVRGSLAWMRASDVNHQGEMVDLKCSFFGIGTRLYITLYKNAKQSHATEPGPRLSLQH
jgi:hypothetical protein